MGTQIRPVRSIELTEQDLEASKNLSEASGTNEHSRSPVGWSTLRTTVQLGSKGKGKEQKAPREWKCNTTGSRAKALFQLSFFLITNFVVVFFLFVYPQISEYMYLESYDSDADAAVYKFRPKRVEITVEDIVDGSPHDQNFLLRYNAPVHLPEDILHPKGWNFQDIMDLPRAMHAEDTYRDPDTDMRMIQNYEICASGCLDDQGRPRDMYDFAGNPARDFSVEPYGEMDRDYYINRNTFLEFLDYDFYNAFLSNGGAGDSQNNVYGGYGLSSLSMSLNNTSPTSSSYLCNLGTQRIKTTAIRIKTQGCHVQIASQEGDKYHLFVKQRHRKGLTASLGESVTNDHTSGCRTQEMLIEVVNPSCRRVQVPGTEEACERECFIVLFKGQKARRLPIIIEPMANLTSPIPTLRVDDQYLVLDSKRTADEYDLSVTGGSMNVEVSRARIRRLDCNLKFGTVHLDHLRHDYAHISIQADDIAVEDNRDYELQYRSAANLVCEAAPLVEEIPKDFLSCEMQPSDSPELHAHIFYDDKLDGYIDFTEFLAGMDQLGLTNSSDSLNLDERMFQQVIDHIFSVSQPDAAVQQLPYEEFEAQLNTVMPPFTTLYDSSVKQQCLDTCPGGSSSLQCLQTCQWYCGHGSIHITEPKFGACDQSQGCVPSCGIPDTSINGNRVQTLGGVNFHHYDLDPPDGVITIEEMRQALLKIYGNCTYYIEPNEQDYITCEYVGSGQYDMAGAQNRRHCTRYSIDDRVDAGQTPYNYNKKNWRIDNLGMPVGTNETLSTYGSQPRECRPFPDYNPKLNGKEFDSSVTATQCPECFLPDGSRAPPHYYNRSTWSSENYAAVMNHVKRIFTSDIVGQNFAYFNISNDDQFRHFTSKLFTKTMVERMVPYETFNANLQTLSSVSGIGENYYLFNPWCYRGSFLKVAPGDYTSEDISNILEETALSYKYASSHVEESNMPGYKTTSDGGDPGINPCPMEWGNGTQGSTMFSYFPWSTVSIGRKWGKRLPVWCFDEEWPSGGDSGLYPNDVLKYGSMAGKEIPPGCEPISCKPLMQANVVQGSIHAQILPFTFDPKNASGSYHTMLSKCQSTDGSSRCFFKGYDANMEERFRHVDEGKLKNIKNAWVEEIAPDESVVMIDVSGFGVPNFKKWFWTSRKVYMQLEPAWLNVFSLGVLDPRLVVADLRITPGSCDQKYGAVPKIDWRDNATYGGQNGLRVKKEISLERILRAKLLPDDQAFLRGNFYLKQVWRMPYNMEGLMYDSTTYNPLTDTEPGFQDGSGSNVGNGPFFRHNRACSSSNPCNQVFAVYRDNCWADRTLSFNSVTGVFELSVCVDNDGNPAYLDPVTRESGLTFNESEYYNMFPRSLNEYSWDEVREMSGGDVLLRNHYVHLVHHSHANATSYFFEKISVEANDRGEVEMQEASREILGNIALALSLALSATIAGTLSMGLMSVLMLFSIKALGKYRAQKKNLKKIDNVKRQDRINAMIEVVSLDYRQSKREAAKDKGRQGDSLSEEELQLPDERKQALLDFLLAQWTEDTDVGDWNVEEMKMEWDSFEAMEKESDPSDEAQSNKTDFNKKLLAVSLDVAPPEAIKATVEEAQELEGIEEPQEEAKGLLTSRMNKAALLQMKTDNKAHSTSRGAQMRLFIIVTLRKLIALLKAIFTADVPSPFDVVDMVIIDQFRRRLINSLRTFVKEKCVQDQPFAVNFEVRLGGTLDDLSEYQEGKTILRLGLETDVAVSRSIFGKIIRYKVAWVRIWHEKKRVWIDGVEVEIPEINVHEGPRVFTNGSVPLANWEESIKTPFPAIGEERLFALPGPESPMGGTKHNYVITAEWGTRTVQISTEGSIQLKELGPTVQFKTVLRNFNPAYEKFCMYWGLHQKNVLSSEGTLKSLNMHVTKRMVQSLKGLRLKTDEDRVKEKPVGARRTHDGDHDDLATDDSKNRTENSLQINGKGIVPTPHGPEAEKNSRGKPPIPRIINETIYVNTEKGLFSSGMKNGMLQTTLSTKGWDKLLGDGVSLQHAASCSSAVERSCQEEFEDGDEEEGIGQSQELMQSNTNMAQFLRSQYVISGKFTIDVEEYEVFKARYKIWCKRMQIPLDVLDTEEFFPYGVIYSEDAFYDIYGVTVNERDLTVNPMGANQHVWYLMRILSVWLHLFCIWLPVYPLIHVTLYHQTLYSRTTAIQPQLTLDDLRSNPDNFGDYAITNANRIVLGICIAWLLLCHLKLVIYYIGIAVPAFRKAYLRGLLKGVFWLFLCLVLSMLVSYILFVFSWLILGAVIRPQAFLPYCTAVVTLFAHAKATATRLLDAFDNYKVKISGIVAAAFAAKIITSLAMKKKKASTTPAAHPEEPVEMEPYPVFQMYAGEDENLDYDEFSALLDRFDIEMIEDKRRMFFAKVDQDGSGQIGYVEFEKAWNQIQREIVRTRMQEAGITKGRVACLFLYSVFLLLLVFAFIFVGVTAFVGEGAFGAVINSSLTAGAGMAMNSGKEGEEDVDNELGIEKAEDEEDDDE